MHAAAATAAFALIPGSYLGFIMGGGLARGFGLCFGLLALWQAVRFFETGRKLPLVLLSAFAALTLLSHIEMAWLLTFSIVVFLVARGRGRNALVGLGIAAVGALVVAAPWWALVLARHGPGPFLAASGTGTAVTSLVLADAAANLPLAGLSLAILLSTTALLLLGCRHRRLLAACWLGLILLYDTRNFASLVALPAALGLGDLVGQAVRVGGARVRRKVAPIDVANFAPAGRLNRGVLALDVAVLLLLTWVVAEFDVVPLGDVLPAVVALAAEEREAMAWVARSTVGPERFVVVSGDRWATDRTAEWFPALAGRVSVVTPQGYEWLPQQAFVRRVQQHFKLQPCAQQDTACLEAWAAQEAVDFSHVFVVKRTGGCCRPLEVSLRHDGRYELVHDGPGGAIFARR